MAITNLIFRRKRNEIGTIQIDATISENHAYSSTVTQFPIEEGSNISDHIINNPLTLTMSGVISNTPVGFLRGKIGSIVRKKDFDVAKTAYEELLFLRDSKTPFTVISTLQEHFDMVFENLTFPRELGAKQALRFTAQMKRINTVVSKTVPFENIKDAFKDRGAQTQSKGPQSTQTPSAAETTRASVAVRLFNFFRGIF